MCVGRECLRKRVEEKRSGEEKLLYQGVDGIETGEFVMRKEIDVMIYE